MKGLFGLGNTNILTVSTMLKENLPDAKVQILGFEDSVRPRAGVILVPTLKLFTKHKKALEAANATVFVFDTPVALEYVEPIKLLDAKRVAAFKYKLYDAAVSDVVGATQTKEKIRATLKPVDVIHRLLGDTLPSVMKPIQTFLYTISNTEHRSAYTKQILHFFASKKTSIEDLNASLISISKHKKSFAALDKVLDFLEEPSAKSTKQVVITVLKADARSKSVNVEKLCEEYKVSSYDVKYILSALRKDKKHFVSYEKGRTTEEIFKEYHSRKSKEQV